MPEVPSGTATGRRVSVHPATCQTGEGHLRWDLASDRGIDDYASMTVQPDSPNLLVRLAGMTETDLDELDFGVIGFDVDEIVTVYNTRESEMAGLPRSRVVGRNVFTEVAPCTNNYLVSERYRTETELDAVLDYVFTLRMRPTPVSLRLLAGSGSDLRYMVVVRSDSDGGPDKDRP